MANNASQLVDNRGARGSNAGDQFHELWALQQALNLLIPTSTVTALTVEGVSSNSAIEDAAVWDGVDCALYHGGETLEAADRIEIAKLKYSSASPNQNWTVARLTRSDKTKGNNSVLKRLADAFAKVRGTMKLNAELIVRLVSNQPVAQEVLDCVKAVWFGPLKQSGLEPRLLANLQAIKTATGLDDGHLRSFLDVLDLSECGIGSRFSLKNSIIQFTAQVVAEDAGATVRELMFQMRDLMMPNHARDVITRDIVLGWFEVTTEVALFPAPSAFKKVTNAIAREPAHALYRQITSGSRIICVHGDAGCGKTTTLLQVSQFLPASSVLVTFDCYGAGRYLRSTDRRHLPEHAFTQILNEVSLAIGLPFVLPRRTQKPVVTKFFFERIQVAAELLRQAHPDALLVIGVDAADNSVTAAQQSDPAEPCFVTELTNAGLSEIPQNVRFVFSARSARKDRLGLPREAVFVPCPPFVLAETEQFVSQTLRDVDNNWLDDFQSLSRGVPRVQDYALHGGGGDQVATLNALRPGGKAVSDVLRTLFTDAISRFGKSQSYGQIMSSLAALPAPIPPKHLSRLTRLSDMDVADFVVDAFLGLRMDDDGITIADEDVEDFIHAEGAIGLQDAQIEATKYFATIFTTDTYAAINYADLLVSSGQEEDILPIVEENLVPAAVADPIIRREVQLRRLRLALAACRRAGDSVKSAKVLLLSAEASKDEAVLAELLNNNPDLSSRFARPTLVRLVLSDPDKARDQGKVLVQDAARAARTGNKVQAREQLRYFRDWLDRRGRAAEREEKWSVSVDDIATQIEAYALLEGAKGAFERLKRWKPHQLHLSVALQLIPRLIARGNSDIVQQLLTHNVVPTAWRVLVLVPLALSGVTIDPAELDRALSKMRRAQIPVLNGIGYISHGENWKTEFLDLLLTACEIGLSTGVPSKTILRTISLVCDFEAKFEKNSSRFHAASLDILLRSWVIYRSLTGAEISSAEFLDFIDPAPPKPKTPRSKTRKTKPPPRGERAERLEDNHKRFVSTLFPVYEARIRLVNHAVGAPVGSEQIDWVKGFGYDAYILERDVDAIGMKSRAAESVLELMHLRGAKWKDLYDKAAILSNSKYTGPFAHHVKSLWSLLLLRHDSHNFLLTEVTTRIEGIAKAREPASEKVDATIDFCRLVLNFSEHDAEALFERTIALAQEIDLEAFDQIKALEALSKHSNGWDREASRETAELAINVYTDVAERLRNHDHFPWKECVASLVRLDASAALAAIASWSDQAIRDHRHTLVDFLEELTRSSGVPPSLATALFVLIPTPPDSLIADTIAHLAQSEPDIARRTLSVLASDCVLFERPESMRHAAQRIRDAAKALPNFEQLLSPEWESLAATLRLLESHPESPPRKEDFVGDQPDVDLTGRRFRSATEIEEAFKFAKEKQRYVRHDALLTQMRESVTSPGDRVPFLNAIASCHIGSYSENPRASAILEALSAWGPSPALDRWRTTSLPRMIVSRFLGLTYGLSERRNVLSQLVDATGGSNADKIEILLNGIESIGLELGGRGLFEVFTVIARTLDADEAWKLFAWYLDRLSNRVSDEAMWFKVSETPKALDAAIGRLLFALMSDVDTRTRWRAAHAANRLAMLGELDCLNELLANYDRTEDKTFRDPSAPFYYLAARLWTVIAVARIAYQTPTALVQSQPKLLSIATDQRFPHVLVREYAKSAVLNLHTAKAVRLSALELKQIGKVNRSTFKRRKSEKHKFLKWEDGKKRPYDYGSDSMEYIFGPILKMFVGLEKNELLKRAEHWLLKAWKAPRGVARYDAEPRERRRRDSEWQLWSSSKGSLPIIERFGGYLEWHATACVVGEFLTKYPLLGGRENWDSLEYWLSQNMVSLTPVWLSDLRSPKPLMSALWFPSTAKPEQWVSRVSRRDFIAAFLWGQKEQRKIVVDGRWSVGFPKQEERVTVSSGLVSPALAASLARSLHLVDRRWPHRLADDDRDEEENRDGEFTNETYSVVGWLRDNENRDGIDTKDTARNGIAASYRIPGDLLSSALKLKASPLPTKAWTSGTANTAAVRHIEWSDVPETYGDSGSYRQRVTKSDGSLIEMSPDVLSLFLKQQKMDLILGVHIERRLEEEYGGRYEHEAKKSKTHQEFYILRADGKIEDRSGTIGSW